MSPHETLDLQLDTVRQAELHMRALEEYCYQLKSVLADNPPPEISARVRAELAQLKLSRQNLNKHMQALISRLNSELGVLPPSQSLH